jgi:glycosyltransferase involved in cell wall biosynthesis
MDIQNKVSCITVTKNRVPFLKKCIDYFNKQTHENKELVIVYYNTDLETESFLLDFIKHEPISDIKIYKFIEDEGMYLGAVRNYAISKSTGDWVCIWDDDDYYSKNRITEQLQYCLDNELDGCTLDSIMIYSNKYQDVRNSFSRLEGWEGSLLAKKDKLIPYKNISKCEDTPVLFYLYHNRQFKTLKKPELYVYIFHDANISGSRHKDDIYHNSLEIDGKTNRKFKDKLGWI